MDGIAAARALTTSDARALVARPPADAYAQARARAADTYDVRIARRDDDAEVRALLRESAFGRDVRLSLEREPDSSLAGSIEGDVHQTIAARHRQSGALVGIASRSVRSAFVNGHVTPIGYLGQLRIHPAFCRRRDLMNAGFDFCRRLDESADRAALHLAAVVSDNLPARRLLARRSPGWPSFEPVDSIVSLAIPVNHRRARCVPDIGVRAGSPELLPEILSCLHRYGSRFQFFPRWTASDFASARTRGLVLEDFVVASRGGRIVGCAACWDQRAFKQVVVRGYSRALRRWRPVINAIAPITGTPRLPAAGTQLPFVYASHLVVEDDSASAGASDAAELTIALLDAVCRRARAKGAEYVVVGLPASSAEVHTVKRAFRHRAYESVLYVAHWPDGAAIASSLDGRPSNPELAIL